MITNSDLHRRYSMKTIKFLTKYNNFDIMQYLFAIIQIHVKNPSLLHGIILEELCKWNYYDTLLLYFQNGPFISSESYNTAFGYACKFGYLNIAKWLLKQKRTLDISYKNNYAFFKACENGHIDIVQWLLTINPSNQKYFHRAFVDASMGNHLELAKWIFQKWKYKLNRNLFDVCKKIFEKACTDGYYELAKWLIEIHHTHEQFVNRDIFRIACQNGHIEIAKWIVEITFNSNLMKPSDISTNKEYTFRLACERGHIDTAQWLFEIQPTIDISADNEYAFRNACKNGHIELAKWLLQIKPTLNVSIGNEYAFCSACVNGYLDIAQWLLIIKPTINVSARNEYAFGLACENGHKHVAQWLFDIKPTIDVSVDNEYAFCLACENGHIDIAQWLFEIQPTIDISADNEYAFRNACKNGHIELAKWLLQIKPTLNVSMLKKIEYDFENNYQGYDSGSYNICEYKFHYEYGYKSKYDTRYENAFSLSCSNGHINIAKWLIELEPTIFQSIIYEDICNNACEQGYIDIIQLIIGMKKNIQLSEITQYFWLACLHGHIEIAKFLYQVNPSITFYDEDIRTFSEISERGYSFILYWLDDIMPFINYYLDCHRPNAFEHKQYMKQVTYYLYKTNKSQVLFPHVLTHIFLNYYCEKKDSL